MLQLIEHVEDPVAIGRAVFRLLRPGGVFVVETPNLGGLDHGWFRGRCWGHYHFPRHWNLFSTASLRRMLESAGFEIARSEYLISTSSWTISIHNYPLISWPAGSALLPLPEPAAARLCRSTGCVRASYQTSNQRLVARKPPI
jgi:SAM-dependent methyltransferase